MARRALGGAGGAGSLGALMSGALSLSFGSGCTLGSARAVNSTACWAGLWTKRRKFGSDARRLSKSEFGS
jgi:hypothetical protein